MACVIAAPASGTGKTLLSLALTAWARSRGLSLQPFKVGPDYLDPQQLTVASGKPCRNLDLLLCGPDWVKESFNSFGGSADLALVEGVMGLFDGIGISELGSTAAVARHLGLPVVLVVDASGQAGSLAALVKGFRDHDRQLTLAGVVLNKVNSNRHKELLMEVLSGIGIKVLGCLPRDPELSLPSRHLGLAPAHELEQLEDRLEAWSALAEAHLDLESFKTLLRAPAGARNPIHTLLLGEKRNQSPLQLKPVAVAQDEAFHFRYPETKECLETLGMPVLPWRPLNDEPLPAQAEGLILPGGFPEQYAERLSKCARSMKELRAWYGRRPIYAECGGMLLLGQSLTDLEGQAHPMTGLLPFHAKKGALQVGYRNLQGIEDSLVVRNGDQLMGHEFHRWELHQTCTNDHLNIHPDRKQNNNKARAPWQIEGWRVQQQHEGWSNKKLHASWVHLHWASSSMIAHRWRAALDPEAIPEATAS
ncbi:MAG: cobyrinate a,c-diamide synthase [Prochlorococcus sp.]|jgi:cobyrinic acid a,c-diamide synthase|nr:cobyrinate a,c-diamide synthase [Prochlorococcaceae cyanobacterium ETNP18_MAG_17]